MSSINRSVLWQRQRAGDTSGRIGRGPTGGGLGLGLFAIVVMVGFGMGGCSKPEYSGFLYPYDGFKKISEFGPDLEYVRPGVDWSKYRKVRVSQVVVYVQATGESRSVDPDDLKAMSDYLETSLLEAFGKNWTITHEAGPDVLDVKAALTRIQPTNRAGAAASWVIPGSVVVTMGYQAATGKSLTLGEAGIEAEMMDSMTGQRLLGFIGLHIGESLEVQQATRWGIAEKALKKWSDYLAGRLAKFQKS